MLQIGNKLKMLRLEKKLTQQELANKLHMTPQTISKWELDKSYPDLDNLLKLSKLFGVSVDTILDNKRLSFFQSIFYFKGKESFDMQLDAKIDTLAQPIPTNAYFLAEMDRLDYNGSAIANAVLYGNQLSNDFSALKNEYPTFNWQSVTLNELYTNVSIDEPIIIVISTKAKAYKNALSNKFPNAHLISQL